jgi:predicted dinucleotide-binding enzyme
VLVQAGEGDIGTSVVITFRAKAAGHTKVIYAATRGESTVARAARTLDVTVTR